MTSSFTQCQLMSEGNSDHAPVTNNRWAAGQSRHPEGPLLAIQGRATGRKKCRNRTINQGYVSW